MTFGLTFTNNNDVVTLDSEFSRLVIVQSGRCSGGAAFSPAITTAEPPLVFVRPDGTTTFQYTTISGGSGNWTGFSFLSAGSGNYFCAAFKSRELATYGLRLWDGGANLLFDSGTPCAQFTRTITSWTYTGSSQTGQGTTKSNWTAYSPLDTGDYMLVNNIGMDVGGNSTRAAKLYVVWNYGNNRLEPYIIGVNNSVNFFIPIVFAKPIS